MGFDRWFIRKILNNFYFFKMIKDLSTSELRLYLHMDRKYFQFPTSDIKEMKIKNFFFLSFFKSSKFWTFFLPTFELRLYLHMDRNHFQFPTSDIKLRKINIVFFSPYFPKILIWSILIDLRVKALFAHGSKPLSIPSSDVKEMKIKSFFFIDAQLNFSVRVELLNTFFFAPNSSYTRNWTGGRIEVCDYSTSFVSATLDTLPRW